jgi:integrase
MRPRKSENRHLPPRLYERKWKRKSGKVWISYYYLDKSGREIALGPDLNVARLKWAELEAKDKPRDLLLMKAIFDRYERDIIPKKAPRTQKDNLAELRQLRPFFEEAPIDAIAPALVAQYRDARSAPVRANREIALLSRVYNLAREWGLTTKENPCQGVRKNKELPRDFYANDAVWKSVYAKAVEELKVAMDLAYLTGQRPADVLVMRKDDIEDKALGVNTEEDPQEAADPAGGGRIGQWAGRPYRKDLEAKRRARIAIPDPHRCGQTGYRTNATPPLG